jgi:hypothetical protein
MHADTNIHKHTHIHTCRTVGAPAQRGSIGMQPGEHGHAVGGALRGGAGELRVGDVCGHTQGGRVRGADAVVHVHTREPPERTADACDLLSAIRKTHTHTNSPLITSNARKLHNNPMYR